MYTQEMTVPEQSIKWLTGTGTGTAGQLPDSAGTASDDDGVHRTYVSVPVGHSVDGAGVGAGEEEGLWESFDALTTFGIKVYSIYYSYPTILSYTAYALTVFDIHILI